MKGSKKPIKEQVEVNRLFRIFLEWMDNELAS
jgi:hypothetical protein